MNTDRIYILFGLLILLLSWSVWILQSNVAFSAETVNYNDVVSEIFSISFILMMLTVNIRLTSQSSISFMVYAGLCCLLVGHSHDLMDEFVNIDPPWISLVFENIANNLGIVIVTIAIFRWSSRYKTQLMALQQQKVELTKASNTDSLSTLYNRRFLHSEFIEQIKCSYSPNKRLSLVMVDLDRFKQINDSYGHLEGDKLIIHMANIIKAEIRENDFAFRYGGEEFLIILNGSIETAKKVAERIRIKYADSDYAIDGVKLEKTTSIGIVEYQPKDDFELAVDIADKALYRAKNSGRNRVICAECHTAVASATNTNASTNVSTTNNLNPSSASL